VIRKVTSAIIAIIMVMTLSSCDPVKDLSKKEIEKYLDMAIEQIYAMDFEKDQGEQVAAMFEILKQRNGLEKTGITAYNDNNFIKLYLQKEQCEKIEYFSEYHEVIFTIYFKKKDSFIVSGICFIKCYADDTYIREDLYPIE